MGTAGFNGFFFIKQSYDCNSKNIKIFEWCLYILTKSETIRVLSLDPTISSSLSSMTRQALPPGSKISGRLFGISRRNKPFFEYFFRSLAILLSSIVYMYTSCSIRVPNCSFSHKISVRSEVFPTVLQRDKEIERER